MLSIQIHTQYSKLNQSLFQRIYTGRTQHGRDHINNFHYMSRPYFTYEQEKKFQLEVDTYYDIFFDYLLKSI